MTDPRRPRHPAWNIQDWVWSNTKTCATCGIRSGPVHFETSLGTLTLVPCRKLGRDGIVVNATNVPCVWV